MSIDIKKLPVTFDTYQTRAMDLAIYPGRLKGSLTESLSYPSLKLCGEAGEVAEKVGKLIRDGIPPAVTLSEWQLGLAKELGDVLWYITAIATEIGYSLQQVAELNLNKLEGRAVRGTLQGSGDNR